MFTFMLTLHLISAILFIGTVYFRTFAMLPFVKQKEYMKQAYSFSGIRGRFLAKIFVTLLLLSGLYLFYIRFESLSITPLLYLKVVIGGILIGVFYSASKIVPKFKHIPNFGVYFHWGMFSGMMAVVILAKFQYFW